MNKPKANATAKPPTSAAAPCKSNGRQTQPCAQLAGGAKGAAEAKAATPTTDTKAEAATGERPNISDCRRSSRKKTPKYDVRDLFNKNRKPEKIQILARIDSNVPSSSASANPNNRPFAMLDAKPTLGENTPSLEIFAKPQPTQGPTLEERESTAPAPAPVAQQPLPVKRGRGRPRKVQPVATSILVQDSDTNSSTQSSTHSTLTNVSASGESDASDTTIKPKKLRVRIKRMAMPVITESDSSTSRESLLKFDPMEASSSSQEATVMQSIDEQHEAATIENDDAISSFPSVLNETAKPDNQNETETIQPVSSNNFKQLFPDKEQKPSELETSTNDDDDADKKNSGQKKRLSKQELKKLKQQQQQQQKVVVIQTDSEMESLSSASSGTRRSNRSRLSFAGSSKMTLEQTFAEIAAVSSELAQSDLVPDSSSLESSSEMETPKQASDQLDSEKSNDEQTELETAAVPDPEIEQSSSEDTNPVEPTTTTTDESQALPIISTEASTFEFSANTNTEELPNQSTEGDKADDQMSNAVKTKKNKNKSNCKKQTVEPPQVEQTTSIAAKKQLSTSPRRHTIATEHPINANKRQSPDRPRSSNSSTSSNPNPKRLAVDAEDDNRPDSLESSASSASCAFAKASETLQATLNENSTSCDSSSSGSKLTSSSCGIPTPTTDLATNDELDNIEKFTEEQADLSVNIITPVATPVASPQVENNEAIVATAPGSGGGSSSSTGGVRRSRRIKKKRKLPKAGFASSVNVKVNQSDSPTTTPALSMNEQLTELALIEAVNSKFLNSEGLNNFQMLRESYYRCARQVSSENAEMQCDCFPNGDGEEALGQACCGDGCINRMLMIECGPLCSYKERCTNKRFQMHQCWPCRVFRTEKKGCGITAEIEIPSGQFIMEYVGEVIDNEEFERRRFAYSRNRNPHYYFMSLRGDSIIDATAKGNISRYINHSCDPNAETQKWTVNGELRIGFFSIKPIMAGEEITFNYQYQRYGTVAQRCYCETAKCSGWVGGKPSTDEVEQLHGDTDSDEVEEQTNDELDEPVPSYEQKAVVKKPIKPKNKMQKQPHLTRRQRKELVKAKDREYKAGRWLPASSGAAKPAPRKPDKLEDADVLDQLSLLNRKGLKNQADTLRFSRCMVRATQLQTRLQLLGVLTRGELPCRRLFLDYHGLRLLHAWINESGSDKQLRLALLEAFESLPIPNKTMLNESRVFQSVQLWSQNPTANGEAMAVRLLALLKKWQALPEIFRIPKRERIEQMKEHEREADGQAQGVQYMNTALEDSNSNSASALNPDPYRQDRFRRDTAANRYEKPKQTARMSGNNTICNINSSNPAEPGTSNGGTAMPTGIIKSESRRKFELANAKMLRRSLFEKKVAKDEAEKRASSEDRREHEARCEYFGADPSTDPKQLPFYQNTETNEWFNSDDQPVPAPKRCGNEKPPKNNVTVEYKLPASVEPLPQSWHYGVTKDGDIYYYNIQDRVSQWEPPSAAQRLEQLTVDVEPIPIAVPDPNDPDSILVEIDPEHVAKLNDKELEEYIRNKISERRRLRHNMLVSVRTISPRREEDRVYNQIEARKYKENKEKIRRRKEIYRRTGLCDIQPPVPTNSTDPLPIQGYLYSSDDDDDDDEDGARCASVPRISAPSGKFPRVSAALQFPDGMFAGRRNWQNESRSFTSNTSGELSFEPSTSKSALATFTKKQETPLPLSLPLSLPLQFPLPMPSTSTSSSPALDQDTEAEVNLKRTERERRNRSERDRIRRTPLSSTSRGREQCEKFRFEISAIVAEYLRPYRKDSCKEGRITSDEDYKFLIKRLSHHITTKEMRYCDMNGNLLSCTDSVRYKSYDFIKFYMSQRGPEYKKPDNEFEF